MSRPPNYEFQEWWNKQRERNPEFFLQKSEPPILTVEIGSPSVDQTVEKERSRSARQLSWVCLLKFQQLANSLSWITHGCFSLVRTANRRIASPGDRPHSASSRLYRVIKVFLIVVLVLLCLELVAYFRGWHFSRPSVGSAAAAEVVDMVELVYAKWLEVRANYLAPPLQSLANVCIVL